jgi:hypothetical protein
MRSIVLYLLNWLEQSLDPDLQAISKPPAHQMLSKRRSRVRKVRRPHVLRRNRRAPKTAKLEDEKAPQK